MLKKLAVAVAATGVLAASTGAFAEWHEGINWAIGNSGPPNCPEQYIATEARFLTEGNRAAVMRRAIEVAKSGNYDYAFRLVLITQCHNGAAQTELATAGKQAVGDYLRTK